MVAKHYLTLTRRMLMNVELELSEIRIPSKISYSISAHVEFKLNVYLRYTFLSTHPLYFLQVMPTNLILLAAFM